MRIYKASKRPLIVIYLFLAAVVLAFWLAAALIKALVERYVPYGDFAEKYMMMPVGIIAGVMAVIVLPLYFRKARFTLTDNEVSCVGGLVITTRQFLSLSAVRSVTSVMLPLSRFTGFNFIILNTMGARVILSFLSRKDAEEIFSLVNGAIRDRGGGA